MARHPTACRCTAFALLAGIALQALAAGAPVAPERALRDPTQPPTPVAAVATAASGAAEAAPVWPRLQSVKVAASGASSAVIDGRLVRVGEHVGALTLVSVDVQGVLLRGAHFDQSLALYPGIAKLVAVKVPR